jgi:hypothetical protein
LNKGVSDVTGDAIATIAVPTITATNDIENLIFSTDLKILEE